MSNHELWNELGNLYFMNGAYEPAIHAYVRSISMDRTFGRSYSNLALAFVQTGKYTEAIELYRHSIELLTDSREKAITWNRLGILYRQVKDYSKALAAYQQADTLDPQQDADAKENVSRETKLPLTVSMPPIDIESILTRDDSTEEILVNDLLEDINAEFERAEIQLEMLWLDDGFELTDLENCFQEEPCDVELFPNKQGEWKPVYVENTTYITESAIADVQKDLLTLLEDADMIVPVDIQGELGDEKVLDDDVLIAEVKFEMIIDEENEITPNEIVFENSETMENTETNNEEIIESEAVQYSQIEYPLTELSPAELNSIELDIDKYKLATQNNPRNAAVWEMLGEAYKSAGMYKDAIFAFQTAISINSTKSVYYYRLGLIYAVERREAEAIMAFQKVLELDPNYALAHASLGSHYLRMGLNELAQTHIGLALNTEFEDDNEYNRACLEAICGNSDRALELLQVALQSRQTHISWAQHDPDLDSLHNDQRFKNLLAAYTTSE